MATKGKILVLVSSGYGLPLKDGKVYAGAGYYLNELTVPVRALMKEGYEITFANPKGNTPQMDVNSAIVQFFAGDEAKLQDYLKFRDTLTGLKNPTRISDVIASGLDQYDAVFVPGGHGPMMDLLDDPDAGTVLRHFHKTSKPTAVLCHGPISLLSALPNSKEFVAALAAGDACSDSDACLCARGSAQHGSATLVLAALAVIVLLISGFAMIWRRGIRSFSPTFFRRRRLQEKQAGVAGETTQKDKQS